MCRDRLPQYLAGLTHGDTTWRNLWRFRSRGSKALPKAFDEVSEFDQLEKHIRNPLRACQIVAT